MKIRSSNGSSGITMGFFCFLVFSVAAFLFPAGIYAQVNAEPAGTVDADMTSTGIEQPLPETGNVTVNFKNVDIKTVLHYLSEVSGVDIVPSPGVEANVTMRLRDKPWEVALDIVTRNYGYAFSRDEEQGIIRIIPKGVLQTEEPVTAVIPLNYIIPNPPQDVTTTTTSMMGSSSTSETKPGTTESIERLLEAVNAILVPEVGENATFMPSANAIVVTAIPARVSSVREMISKVDKKTPQIMLEAKVIEITLDKNDQFGVDWNTVISLAGASRPITFPFTKYGTLPFLQSQQKDFYPHESNGTNLLGSSSFPVVDTRTATNMMNPTSYTTSTNSSSLFSFGTLDFTSFQATLRLIDEWDNTDILSSPRITTLNNHPATIKVIDNVFLQKQQTSTDSANVISVQFEEDPREVGVILEVTPHVNNLEEITVDLKPQISRNLTFTELEVSNSQNTVAMQYSSREAETQVMVKDGETIFIGGLITKTESKEDHSVPILGDLFKGIPMVGSLFNYNQNNVDKTEVVFFVTVHILKNGMDSIRAAQSTKVYNKAFDKRDKELSKKSVQRKRKSPPKLTKKTDGSEKETGKILGEKVSVKAGKEYKPFLDFRGKK